MLVAVAERTELGHLGARRWTTERRDNLVLPAKDGCVLVWLSDQQAAMPDLIVVQDGKLEDFLAWTTTYVPQLTPLTALVRVAGHRTATKEIEFAANRAQQLTDQETRHLRGGLGLVHAEVVAACRGAFAPINAGLTPYLSTLSWLALQSQCLNLRQSLKSLHDAWDEIRQLVDARRPSYSLDVEEVYAIVAEDDLAGGAERNRQANQIRAFISSVAEGNASIGSLDGMREHAASIEAVQTGPLEGRVGVFRRLVQVLYERDDVPAASAVLVGYALSQISQGSFSHIGLLGPERVSDPRPLLWYGWFEFSRDKPDPSSPIFGAASLQLMRRIEVMRKRPCRGDVALDELRVLGRRKAPFAECLLDIRHPISVEVAAGAITVAQPGNTSNQQVARTRHGQRSLFDDVGH